MRTLRRALHVAFYLFKLNFLLYHQGLVSLAFMRCYVLALRFFIMVFFNSNSPINEILPTIIIILEMSILPQTSEFKRLPLKQSLYKVFESSWLIEYPKKTSPAIPMIKELINSKLYLFLFMLAHNVPVYK